LTGVCSNEHKRSSRGNLICYLLPTRKQSGGRKYSNEEVFLKKGIDIFAKALIIKA
jgi:hypothetical protein